VDLKDYRVYGCLLTLSQCGPLVVRQSIVPNISQLMKVPQLKRCVESKKVLAEMLKNLKDYIEVSERAQDSHAQMKELDRVASLY